MKRLALSLSILAIAGTLWAQPARDVHSTVRRFYERYAAGDLDGVMALWSDGASERAAFRSRLAGILRVRCVEIRSVDVTRVDVDDRHAVADAAASLVKWSRHTGRAVEETELATFTFARNAAGEWRLTGWKRQEDALADALTAAKTADERRALLDAQRRLVTPALVQILERRGTQLANQEHYAEAMELARTMEEIAAGTSDLAGLASALGIESVVWRRQENWYLPESLRDARQAVALAETSGDADVLTTALFRLGRAEHWNHVADDGKTSYLRAIDLLGDVENVSAVANCMADMAEYYAYRSDRHAELYYAVRGLELAVAGGDLVARLNAELHLSSAYDGISDCTLAIPHLQAAVGLSHAANVTGSVPAEALYELARCHLTIGDEKAFFADLKQAAAEPGYVAEETMAFGKGFLAQYYLDRGELARAARAATEGLRLAKTGYRTGVRDSLLATLLTVRLQQKRGAEALALAHEMAASRARNYLAARAERMLGRHAQAYRDLERAIEESDINSTQVATDERQMEIWFAGRAYELLEMTDMLVEDHRVADALHCAERTKSRLLLEVLRGGRGVVPEMMTKEQRQQERALQERVAAAHAHPDDTAALREARTRLEEYRTLLYNRYPRLQEQRGAVPVVTRAQMAELLDRRSSAFVEYVVTPVQTHVFIVRRNGSGGLTIRCRTIHVHQKQLAAKIEAFVRSVAGANRLYAVPSRELYQLLVGPLESELRGVQTLCIIPDGPLWELPFESLLAADGRFLIERTAVFYAPSITVYREMLRRDRAAHAPGAFLAFADPPVARGGVSESKLRDAEYAPLPDAEREVESIGKLFHEPTRIYVGAEALESRAKAESPHYAVIHFATHGMLDDRDPMFSHLVLAPRPGDPSEDGLLETWEMLQLDLHANLAVLSACDTARGTVHAGEGLIGMAWALSVAGTSSTIVTQWKIASSTAADLMVDFYREWLGARSNAPFAKAEALRRARLHVLSDPAHRHPFYWSAFVLIGSGS